MPDTHHPSAHARKVLETVNARDSSFISSSWRRCLHLHRLDPDAGHARARRCLPEVEGGESRSSALIAAAKCTLDSLFGLVKDAAGTVLMTDSSGIVVAVRSADSQDFWRRTAQRWTGVDLSESAEGTNAVGMCLIEKRPIIISDGNHFYDDNARLDSIGAPIFGASGDLVGCLDVVRHNTDELGVLSALILSAVADAARRIEVRLFVCAHPNEWITTVPQFEWHASALLAIGQNANVVGATRAARRVLALSEAQIAASFPAADLWAGKERRETTLLEQERVLIKRALRRHNGNVSTAAKALGIGRGTLHRKLKEMGPSLDSAAGRAKEKS